MFIVSVAVDILFNVLPFFAEVLCLCFVMYYFVPCVVLQCVIVVSPDQTDLLFWVGCISKSRQQIQTCANSAAHVGTVLLDSDLGLCLLTYFFQILL